MWPFASYPPASTSGGFTPECHTPRRASAPHPEHLLELGFAPSRHHPPPDGAKGEVRTRAPRRTSLPESCRPTMNPTAATYFAPRPQPPNDEPGGRHLFRATAAAAASPLLNPPTRHQPLNATPATAQWRESNPETADEDDLAVARNNATQTRRITPSTNLLHRKRRPATS